MKNIISLTVIAAALLLSSCGKETQKTVLHKLVYQLVLDTSATPNIISNFRYLEQSYISYENDSLFRTSVQPGVNSSAVRPVIAGDYIYVFASSIVTDKFHLQLLLDGNVVKTSPVPSIDSSISDSTYATRLEYYVP